MWRSAPENLGPFTLFLVRSRRGAPGNFGAHVWPLPATAKTYFFVHSGIRSADLAFSASDRVRSPQVTAGNDRPCAVLERRVDLSF